MQCRCVKVHESARECANTFWRITNMDAGSICWNPVALAEKTWLMVNADCPHVIHRTDKGTNTMGVKHSASIGVGRMWLRALAADWPIRWYAI